MEVDRDAPVVAEATIEIVAAPDVVWATVSDFERWPEWNPDVKAMSLGGITSTLRSVERPRELGSTGKTLGIDAVHVWRFEPKDDATIAWTVESWAGWLPRLLSGPMRTQLQKGLDASLPHLKAEAERRAVAR